MILTLEEFHPLSGIILWVCKSCRDRVNHFLGFYSIMTIDWQPPQLSWTSEVQPEEPVPSAQLCKASSAPVKTDEHEVWTLLSAGTGDRGGYKADILQMHADVSSGQYLSILIFGRRHIWNGLVEIYAANTSNLLSAGAEIWLEAG